MNPIKICFTGIWLVLSVLASQNCYGQKSFINKIDSLKQSLTKTTNDSSAIVLYYEIAQNYTETNRDSLLFYANKLFNKIGESKAHAFYYHVKGLIAYNSANFDSAIWFYNKAVKLFIKEGNIKKIAEVYNDLGVSNDFMSNYPEALNNYFKSISYYERINYKIGISNVYNNIGIVFKILGEYDSAYAYYFRTSELKTELHDKAGISLMYNNMADLKIFLKEYDLALEFLNKSITLNKEIGYERLLGYNYANVGVIKFKQGHYDEAKAYYKMALDFHNSYGDINSVSDILIYQGQLEFELKNYGQALYFYNKSLGVKKEISNKIGQAIVLIYISKCLEQLDRIKESISKAKMALQIAVSIGARSEAKDASNFLQKIFAKKKDFDRAYYYLNIYDQYMDSLFSEQMVIDIGRVESKYVLSEAQKENEILQKERAIQVIELDQNKLQIKNQKTTLIALFICMLFALTAAIFWYLYTQRKHKTIFILRDLNDEINQKKEQIELQTNELQKAHNEVKLMNDTLEDLVKERTDKILKQTSKLKDYAFANSHEVKAPLSQLLALVNSSTSRSISVEEKSKNINQIENHAMQLDGIIKKLNDVLREEKL